MKIILTGSTGLIGSRFVELMSSKHEIIPLLSRDVDITNQDQVDLFLEDNKADVVLHLAAKTDVDGCENDKEDDMKKIKENIGKQEAIWNMSWNSWDWVFGNSAFAINFIGTMNLYEKAQSMKMNFVYISTDFVFKGEGKYDEESEPSPVNWYGMTKWYGEKFIDSKKDLIVRLSFPFGYPSLVKKDFIQKLIGLLKERKEVFLVEDQTITPTFIDDIVYGIEFLLKEHAKGIYHLTGSSYRDPYEIGQKIKKDLGLDTKISPIVRDELYKGKAARPFQSIMLNDKIKKLGFVPKTFDEAFELIKSSI